MNKSISKHITILSLLLIVLDSFKLVLGISLYVGIPFASSFIPDYDAASMVGGIGEGIGLVVMLLSIPGIIGGIGLINYKKWSRLLALIICVFKLLSIPFGTALGIYGIWVLMQDDAIDIYKK